MPLTIEKLKEEVSSITDEREKIDRINWFCFDYIDFRSEECYLLAKENLKKSQRLNYRRGEGFSLLCISHYQETKGQYEESFLNSNKGLDIFKETEDIEGQAMALNFISYANWWRGKYDLALEQAFKALNMAEMGTQALAKGWTNYAMGVFYFDLKDYTLSEKYYIKAEKIFLEAKHDYGAARSKSGIGSNKIIGENYTEALQYIVDALEEYKRLGHQSGEARALNDIGLVHKKLNNLQEAENYLLQSLNIRQAINYKQGIITTLMELGDIYTKSGNYDKAKKYLTQSLEVAEQTKTKAKIFQTHHLLSELYKKTGDSLKALEHLEKFYEIKTEVIGEQATNKLKNLQTQFATEKSEKEAEIHRLKNVELKKANEEIEQKNKDITDSIKYAKRIQEAILPPDKLVKEHLHDSFIFYKPKDIVSGDFYWIEKIENKTLFAAVDCTGHGVPGAFVSIVGHNGLSRVVNEFKITQPSLILDKLNEIVGETFRQQDNGEVKDGMDIALCSIDFKSKTLEYSGAMNSLYIISNGEIKEVKADKQPIGAFDNRKNFTNHLVKLKISDCFYIFSDGYADQFGGPNGKKFLYKRFQELLLSIHTKPMNEQKEILDKTIMEWKEQHEQVDDILVIGVKI